MSPIRIRVQVLICVVLLTFLSCDNEFSAKAPYNQRLTVFALLDNTAAFQVVRVESTYDVQGTNPAAPSNSGEIDSARVTIRSNKKLYELYDTLLLSTDGKRKRVWISHELKPESNVSYHLSVRVPGFNEITSDVQVPMKLYLQAYQKTYSGGMTGVLVSVGIPVTRGIQQAYYFRLWLAAEKEINGRTVEIRKEIPLGLDESLQNYVYSVPLYDSEVFFPMTNILAIRKDLTEVEKAVGLRFIVTGYALDLFFFNYYKIVRGFDDPVSTRLDSPDVSNMIGGLGVFGAVITDSLKAGYSDIVSR